MRLLQLCTHFEGGGISRHVIDLSAALRARGHYVAIAGTRGKWMSEEKDADFFFIDLHNVAEAGGSVPRRLLAALRGGLALRRVLKKQRIEMIHAHESAPALVARIAAMGTGIPVYVTFHGAEPERIAQFGQIARFSADRVLTPSHNSARDLREIAVVEHAHHEARIRPLPPAVCHGDQLGNTRHLHGTVTGQGHDGPVR